MKLSLLLAGLTALVLLTGCVGPASIMHAPLMLDVKGPWDVGDSSVGCDKVGTAEVTGIILFTQGDASIKAAMENGGITKVHHVDFKAFNILNLFAKFETIVYGE